MDGLKEIIKKKLFKILGKEAEGDAEEVTVSMKEGKIGKVFGINRKIVTGIAGFFGLVFVIAVIMAASDSKGTEVGKMEELKKITEEDIADTVRTKNELPNDYASFVAMNAQKNSEPQKSEKKSEPVETKISPKQQVQSVPIVPKNNYAEVKIPETPKIPQMQVPKMEKSEEEKKLKGDEREKYNAPIAFASFKETEKNSEVKVAEEKTKVSYKKVNGREIIAGTLISARLLTGINTEISGQVTAQILEDVYNFGKDKILIPQGSKIIGEYDKEKVADGRVAINFSKIIFPDGGMLSVEKSLVAVDDEGYTGIVGKIHHHTGQKITAGAVGTAIAAMGAVAAGNTSSGDTYTAGQLAGQGAMANLMNVTSKMFDEAAKVADTITIEPGSEFQIYVKEDLEI